MSVEELQTKHMVHVLRKTKNKIRFHLIGMQTNGHNVITFKGKKEKARGDDDVAE